MYSCCDPCKGPGGSWGWTCPHSRGLTAGGGKKKPSQSPTQAKHRWGSGQAAGVTEGPAEEDAPWTGPRGAASLRSPVLLPRGGPAPPVRAGGPTFAHPFRNVIWPCLSSRDVAAHSSGHRWDQYPMAEVLGGTLPLVHSQGWKTSRRAFHNK